MRHPVAALQFGIFLLCLSILASGCGRPATLKLPATRDMVVWMYRGQSNYNFGAMEPLWVEGVHYAAVLGFDARAAQGRRVSAARLWLHRSGDTPLYSLVVSTISADWIEGTGNGTGPQEDASSAAWVRVSPPSGDPQLWAGPGSDITDVIFSQGNSLRSGEATVRQESGGWQSVAVSDSLVYALADGAAYGLAILDATGELRTPDGNFIRKSFNSRDSRQYAPYLELTLEAAPEGSPQPPAQVRCVPAPERAGIESGSLSLVVTPQGEGESRGYFYEAALSDSSLDDSSVEAAPRVERWRIPRVSAAGEDTVELGELPPGAARFAAVRTLDRYGRASAWVFAQGEVSPARGVISFTPPKRPDLGRLIRVWVCGPDEKVNPVSGRLLEESPALYDLPGDGDYEYKYAGPLWDARTETVSLDVPRGGTASFQVLVEPEKESIEGVSIRADWLDNPAGVRSRYPAQVFRDWYLRGRAEGEWYPEVAVPQSGEFSIPDTLNKIPGQRNQGFIVEFYTPRDCPPGRYRASVVVGARGLLSRALKVEINVHRAVLPEALPFVAEMNIYSPVADQYGLDPASDEYYDIEQQYYRLAHEHLAAINQLPYSQTGEIKAVGAPRLEGEGENMRVADWAAWDRRWGRYLDGSAFEGMDRRAPVPVMYLPFHENWPASLKKFYRFTPRDTTYPGMVNERALEAPEIEQAFDPEYTQEWVGVLRQFASHFREKGWTGTQFQVYLNNKYYWKDPGQGQGGNGISWWLLDEPYHWDDFRAIGWFGGLFMQAVGDVHDVDMVFRIDVSRPQLQFGLWDGIRSVSYVSATFYEKNAFLTGRLEKYGSQMRNYGAFNDLEETNLTATAWPLKVWLNHGSGLLPWQTVGSDSNFERFQNTAIFYPGMRFGIRGPLASLRLKACRRGVEDAVLLEMLARRNGWSREQAALAAAGCLDLGGGTRARFLDDAGQVNFAGLDRRGLTALRRAILRSLDESADKP